jgi:hypothetical protein
MHRGMQLNQEARTASLPKKVSQHYSECGEGNYRLSISSHGNPIGPPLLRPHSAVSFYEGFTLKWCQGLSVFISNEGHRHGHVAES